jgi:fructose/tagatose bisphosphate aldolase
VIDAATQLESPLIDQTSLKTVKSIEAKVLYEMFHAMAEDAPVPITLHLDHCPTANGRPSA